MFCWRSAQQKVYDITNVTYSRKKSKIDVETRCQRLNFGPQFLVALMKLLLSSPPWPYLHHHKLKTRTMNSDKEYFLPSIYKNAPQESNKNVFWCDWQNWVFIKCFLKRFKVLQFYWDPLITKTRINRLLK